MYRKTILLSLLVSTVTASAGQAAAPIVYNGDKFYGINGPRHIEEVAHRLNVGAETTYLKADSRDYIRQNDAAQYKVIVAAPVGVVAVKDVSEPDANDYKQAETAYHIEKTAMNHDIAMAGEQKNVAAQQVASADRSFLPSNLFQQTQAPAVNKVSADLGKTKGQIALGDKVSRADEALEQMAVVEEVSFIKPVFGEVISGYGSKQNGKQNDGINIAAPLGTPIRSAADGKVVYAGNELQGYGNMVIVRHDNGWMSAYAHADTIRVSADQEIRQGDVLGTVGKTGNVSTPQLHFGLRNGDSPVDPMSKIQTSYAAVR